MSTFAEMEKILLGNRPTAEAVELIDLSPQPVEAEPVAVDLVANPEPVAVEPVANPEPPIPDFDAERDPTLVKATKMAMVDSMRLEDGEAEPE